MADVAAEEFMQRCPTDDVRAAVHWLLDNGYSLARAQIGPRPRHFAMPLRRAAANGVRLLGV